MNQNATNALRRIVRGSIRALDFVEGLRRCGVDDTALEKLQVKAKKRLRLARNRLILGAKRG